MTRSDGGHLTLTIRHKVYWLDGVLCVEEWFGLDGGRPTIRWTVPDSGTADKLVAERIEILKEMLANISPDVATAVREAVYIDNLKAGHS